MKPRLRPDENVVLLGDDARNRFYGSSGYGRPEDSELSLSLVEAAHLLRRGKIKDIEGKGFDEFVEEASKLEDNFATVFEVYSDLRERGYYLQHRPGESSIDVYPRGKLPSETSPKEEVRVTDEDGHVRVDELVRDGDGGSILGVVDSEGDVTYFRAERWDENGGTEPYPESDLEGRVVGDRIVVEEYGDVYSSSFYGSQTEDDGRLMLSPEEAVYLDDSGILDLSPDVRRGIEERSEDEVFEIYSDLRGRGLCPKTGFKFGTEFRVYETVTDVEDLPHSEILVDTVKTDKVFEIHELSRAVRLAHGVRKEMVFGVVGAESDASGDGVKYVSVSRYRP
ncbi:MAG: tRNA-intron lyase [Halobacteria archaeon]|nr:tRNA-intron lyase [Halobacteria archaeon]